jgi:5-methylcytosine-specific restriction endonuclease McrA
MPFSQGTKDAAFSRAGGVCECTRKCSHHTGRCRATLRGEWHAHHKTAEAAGGTDDLSNCEALCQTCHKNTETFGSVTSWLKSK